MNESEKACCEAKRNYYSYYDTPEGKDIEKKMMVTARYGTIVGLVAGTYDVLMYSHAVGMRNVLRRYAFHVLPLAAMGATFAFVANGVQNYRKENDLWNYFLGGLACGPILALYTGTAHAIVPGGLALGAAAIVKKTAIDSGTELFPDITSHRGTCNGWRNDFTLVADPRDCSCESKDGEKKK